MNFEQLLENAMDDLNSDITGLTESEVTKFVEIFDTSAYDYIAPITDPTNPFSYIYPILTGLMGFIGFINVRKKQKPIDDFVKSKYPNVDRDMKAFKRDVKRAKNENDVTKIQEDGKKIIRQLKRLQRMARNELPPKQAAEIVQAIQVSEHDFNEFVRTSNAKLNARHPMEEQAINEFPDFLVQGITESGNLILSNGKAIVEFDESGKTVVHESKTAAAFSTWLGTVAAAGAGMIAFVPVALGAIGIGAFFTIPIVTGVGVGLGTYGIVRGAGALTSALSKISRGAMGQTVSSALGRLEKIIVERDGVMKEAKEGKIDENQAKQRMQKLTRDMQQAADHLERVIHREGGMEQLEPPERRQIETYLKTVRDGAATGFAQ